MIFKNNKIAGFLIVYWDKAEDIGTNNLQLVLHEPTVSKAEYRISGGSVKQVINGIDECTLTIGMLHQLYKKITPIKGIVKVINLFDAEVEFYGRVLTISNTMTQDGFAQEVICEDFLAYLHDSVQDFEKVPNNGLKDYLTRIINRHNAQVEPHKRFKIGIVDVPAPSDTPFRYTGYDSSWDTIKERLIDKTGGYLVLRHESDGMYLDYLKEIGQVISGSPIMLGENIKEAKRDLNFDGLLTRIVPIGADLDNGSTSDGTSTDIIRPQVTIKSVNNGLNYLEDQKLIDKFGLISKSVTWSNINDPGILKLRGQQYLDSIKAIIASWQVGVVDRYLIDSNYIKLKVGNTHEIRNAPMAGVETLQIIEKNIDLLKPQSVSLSIGADSQSLSTFNLQQQEARKSMEKVIADNAAQQKLAEQQNAILYQISLLESELAQYQAQVESYAIEVQTIDTEIAKLDPTNDADLIASLTTQRNIADNKRLIYQLNVNDTQSKIDALKLEVTNG